MNLRLSEPAEVTGHRKMLVKLNGFMPHRRGRSGDQLLGLVTFYRKVMKKINFISLRCLTVSHGITDGTAINRIGTMLTTYQPVSVLQAGVPSDGLRH